jgi:queuine tRNA-ribosyltransferase
MGVGAPTDLVDAIERGVDLFDCVLPTREGRNGRVYTRAGVVHIKNAALARDPAPLDPACAGVCCREYSRGTLRHLFHVGEMLGPMLLSLHNLRFFLGLAAGARAAIAGGSFPAFAAGIRAAFPEKVGIEEGGGA